MREADARDIPALSAFLAKHINTSMFLLSNLENFGIGNRDHAFATRYFLFENSSEIQGVIGFTNNGMLMCQLPEATDPSPVLACLGGHQLLGMTGHSDQVGQVLDRLPVSEGDWQINMDEPLYSLGLAELGDCADTTRPVRHEDLSWLIGWQAHYAEDAGLASRDKAEAEAEAQAQSMVNTGQHRLLFEDDEPVALAGLNARAGDAVQVGGVFTPRDKRGQGYAGRVVSAVLSELRREANLAILVAASHQAARAYEKIGFTHVGAYRVALLKSPITLGDNP